jgi:hypothetical protein
MTEEIEKIKQWKYDFAWKQLENAQIGNEHLDHKAMNNINFSSLIIPIITAILLYISDKSIAKSLFYVLLTESLIFLIVCIFFAFAALWLRDQGNIKTVDQFYAIRNAGYLKIIGGTSQDLANWQKIVVEAGENKAKYVMLSSVFFAIALILIFVAGICLLLF